MNPFLKQILSSGNTGQGSSKRSAMAWFILLFTGIVVVNLATAGRVKPDATIQSQVFDLVIISIGAVFGENFLPFLRRTKPTDLPTDSGKQ